MQGYKANIEQLTQDNENFRKVVYTATHVQIVLMSLNPGEEIGQEVHDVDQFFRFEKGQGKVVIDDHEHNVGDGDVVVVPEGSQHNVINTSDTEPLKLYTLYCPPHHRDGIVHATKEEALADDEHFDGQVTHAPIA